jgi:nickel/cobalt transporter (NicO) family protein
MRRRRLLVAAITLATIVPSAVIAHVAPSVDDNNRYIKLTPMGDRVRLAYTVFFGEIPGAEARRSIDTNRDGTISEEEAQVFGNKVAAEVAGGLDISVDGSSRRTVWADVVVGMGTQRTAGGAFAIDLIAYVCMPSRGKHHLVLRDRFRVPRPGETEVKVEDSPGIAIERAHIGPADDASHDYRFVGPGGPLSDDGLELVYTASDKAPAGDSACAAPAPPPAPTPTESGGVPIIFILLGVAGIAVVLVIIVVAARGRR